MGGNRLGNFPRQPDREFFTVDVALTAATPVALVIWVPMPSRLDLSWLPALGRWCQGSAVITVQIVGGSR
jgi:hypothetical protein